jgi:hypothetical protein
MTSDQLRTALKELNGERDVQFVFTQTHGEGWSACHVKRAMLVPDEADHLVKVTDGRHVFIVDAERVAWLRIG